VECFHLGDYSPGKSELSMFLTHSLHPKGWGEEEWLVNIDQYCAKILRIGKGKKCSLHFHRVKTETFNVLSGRVLLRFGPSIESLEEALLEKNQSFHVPQGILHQFEGLEDSELLEVSTQHFEEDSVRVVKGD
jgi:mannose-6-phosphate isomerase-like protein (cupin superfamily)